MNTFSLNKRVEMGQMKFEANQYQFLPLGYFGNNSPGSSPFDNLEPVIDMGRLY